MQQKKRIMQELFIYILIHVIKEKVAYQKLDTEELIVNGKKNGLLALPNLKMPSLQWSGEFRGRGLPKLLNSNYNFLVWSHQIKILSPQCFLQLSDIGYQIRP